MRIRPLVLAFLAGGFFIGADFASAAVDANGNALPDEGSSDQAAELAKQLQNPVASLISVPFQNNFDFHLGPNDDGFRYTLNFQPVIPLSISKDYNLIIRTIVPFIHQDDVIPGTNQDGLSDIVQSFFFSPKQPVAGWILALGPVFLWPTATNDLLARRNGARVRPVCCYNKREDGYGILFNHIWSYAGDDHRTYVSSLFSSRFSLIQRRVIPLLGSTRNPLMTGITINGPCGSLTINGKGTGYSV